MADIVEHFKRGTFEERYWLPAHNERRESSLFRKNKKFIRDECGTPCWVCKSKEDREVHHIFEWAFWNALDREKVTNILNAIEFYDDDYVSQADKPDRLRARIRQIERRWPIIRTPDDIRNLVVFCRKHHRLRYTGVHTITFPIWLSVAGVPSEGGILTRDQIVLATERVRRLDEELATFAENDYVPQTLEAEAGPGGPVVNVNTASFKDLVALPGIGDALARLIVEKRPYVTLEELRVKVTGIGHHRIEGLRNRTTV